MRVEIFEVFFVVLVVMLDQYRYDEKAFHFYFIHYFFVFDNLIIRK